MNENRYSSESELDSDFSSTKSESENSAGNPSLKRVVYCLSFMLVMSTIVIILLILAIIFIIFKSSNEKVYNPQVSTRFDGFEYPFYHPDEGNTKIRGTVIVPEPITEPINIFSDDGSQVMLIIGEESEMKVYTANVYLYCCPPYLVKRRSNWELRGCDLIFQKNFDWPGKSEGDVEAEITVALLGVLGEDLGMVSGIVDGEGNPFKCPNPEKNIPELEFFSIKENKGVVLSFSCEGSCIKSDFEYFIWKNPSLAEKGLEESVLRSIHEEYSSSCQGYSTSTVIDDGTKSRDELVRKFSSIMQSFCLDMEMKVTHEEIEGKFSSFCFPDPDPDKTFCKFKS